jgi:hypothetical protein
VEDNLRADMYLFIYFLEEIVKFIAEGGSRFIKEIIPTELPYCNHSSLNMKNFCEFYKKIK